MMSSLCGCGPCVEVSHNQIGPTRAVASRMLNIGKCYGARGQGQSDMYIHLLIIVIIVNYFVMNE